VKGPLRGKGVSTPPSMFFRLSASNQRVWRLDAGGDLGGNDVDGPESSSRTSRATAIGRILMTHLPHVSSR
jgi:hypothetical protein